MDYMKFVAQHRASNSDITIGCLPCDYERASDFGLMKINEEGRIVVRPTAWRLLMHHVFFICTLCVMCVLKNNPINRRGCMTLLLTVINTSCHQTTGACLHRSLRRSPRAMRWKPCGLTTPPLVRD